MDEGTGAVNLSGTDRADGLEMPAEDALLLVSADDGRRRRWSDCGRGEPANARGGVGKGLIADHGRSIRLNSKTE